MSHSSKLAVRPKQDGEATESGPSGDTSREEALLQYFLHILISPSAQEEPLPAEFESIPNGKTLRDMLWGIRKLALALSNGDLDHLCQERGFVVGALKALQANMRHLTWQAQRIAGGEYHHRVQFLGDFSVAFNTMAEQLDTTINNLTSLTEKYKDLSHKDALTGLYNRKAFFDFFQQVLLTRSQLNKPSTLIMIDLDNFKHVNDTYGHLAGDAVLQAAAQCMLGILRPTDVCCRYGGEEFVVLMPGATLEVGLAVAERLRVALEEEIIEANGQLIRITGSFGLSEVRLGGSERRTDEIMKEGLRVADDNLYKAKSAGRNCIVS